MRDLIIIDTTKKRKLSKSWDYNISVKKVMGFIYKAKNLTDEMIDELWEARERLSKEGRNWDKSPSKTWSDYCRDIGSQRRIVNRWLAERLLNTEKQNRIEEEQKDRLKRLAGTEIRKGDFKKVLADIYNIDAIITDPPYPQEFINCFSELSLFAKEHLKKDGFMAIYSGQYHLPEVIKRLSEHLTYVWTFCLNHSGKKQIVNNVNIMCGWKPVLIFSNGSKRMRYPAYDVLISGQREKSSHEWQQSESGVYQLIDIFSRPGELIVDPFAGSGTFLKVAYENGRRAIGAEIK